MRVRYVLAAPSRQRRVGFTLMELLVVIAAAVSLVGAGPQLEQPALFHALNVDLPIAHRPATGPSAFWPYDPANTTAMGTTVGLFLCPGDSAPAPAADPGPCNYAFCAGDGWPVPAPRERAMARGTAAPLTDAARLAAGAGWLLNRGARR